MWMWMGWVGGVVNIRMWDREVCIYLGLVIVWFSVRLIVFSVVLLAI